MLRPVSHFSHETLTESRDSLSALQEKKMNLAASPGTGELTHDDLTKKRWICRPEGHVIIKDVFKTRIDFSTESGTFTSDVNYIAKVCLINIDV